MYKAIRSHPPVSEIYGKRLVEQKAISTRRGSTITSSSSRPCSRASSRRARATSPTRRNGSRAAGRGCWRRSTARRRGGMRHRGRAQVVRRDRPHADDRPR
ncbi:hypothetical protein AB5I41_15155 [Sphingomonas sp. MMS24-JH45]